MLTLETGQTLRAVAGTATAVTYTIFGDALTTANAYKVLAQGQLPSSVGTLYTVPASTSALINSIRLANTTGTAVTGIKFYVGGTAAANQLTGSFDIPANGTATLLGNSLEIQDATGALVYAGLATTAYVTGYAQPLDPDLTTIAGLTATTDNVIQSVGSAWASRTPAQLKATLALVKGDVGLGSVDNTSNATERAATATLTNKTLTSPVITTPTGIVKGDVGLGNVDNTSNATERAASATLTNKTLTSPVINTPTGIVKGDVGLGNVDNTSDASKPVSTAQAAADAVNAASIANNSAVADRVASGMETFSRGTAATTSSMTSGTVRLTYFTAYTSMTVVSLASGTGGTAAATPTTCKMGLYSIDLGTGDLTRIAITANDTTLWAATQTKYAKALASSVAVTAGTRYVFATLYVGTTVPILSARTVPQALGSDNNRMMAALGSQTDIPTSITAASLAVAGQQVYGELIP